MKLITENDSDGNLTEKKYNSRDDLVRAAEFFIIKWVLRTSTMSKYLIKFSLLQWLFVTNKFNARELSLAIISPALQYLQYFFSLSYLLRQQNDVLRRYQAPNLNFSHRTGYAVCLTKHYRHCNVTWAVVCQTKIPFCCENIIVPWREFLLNKTEGQVPKRKKLLRV